MPNLSGQRLCVDTNVFIYLGEQHAKLGPTARSLFKAAHEGFCALVTSELTLAEVLVLAFKWDQKDLQQQYMEALSPRRSLDIIPVSSEILVASARTRAIVGGKLPDSVHTATALAAGCAVYISEDRDIRTPDGLQLVSLSNLSTMLPGTP